MTDIARSPKQIGALIRKHRRARDLNQTELGAKTSLRQATISNIENGEDATRIGTICDVLAALGLELVIRPRGTQNRSDLEDVF
ncbi:MAG: helix-turn-helix domain-containing protein [Pseudomonadota bacterium]